MSSRLLLFDIDGTLLLSGGAGARAMMLAFDQVFGAETGVKGKDAFAGVPMAGRTDTWIFRELSRVHGVESGAESLQRFHDSYVGHLRREIHEPGPRKGVLPGVKPLLDALAQRPEAHLALLTGNFAAGARVKLEHFDLWRYFPTGAFAEDAADRNSLFAHALSAVVARGGPRVAPSDVVVVGDTPFDVGVATTAGARSVAVATGSFDRRALADSGADAVLEDFTDLAAVLDALGLN
jgi:phosphoglycolate phosphatase-like HAD superfamily hydrolase